MNTHVIGVTAEQRYRTDIEAARHKLLSDEPAVLGGANLGHSLFALRSSLFALKLVLGDERHTILR